MELIDMTLTCITKRLKQWKKKKTQSELEIMTHIEIDLYANT